jgi:hypothetical protein
MRRSVFYALRETLNRANLSSRITPQSTEAFIIRLFRQKNIEGFLKAFSDEPEYLTVGFSPLKDVMKELQVRNVHIYPRSVLISPNLGTDVLMPVKLS